MYKVLYKDTIKSKILLHLSVAKRGDASKKGDLVGELSIHALQGESLFPVAYNEGKTKRMPLCFLCSYVNIGVFMSKHEKRTNNSFTHPLVFLLTCPLVNSPTTVIFSARNLTLKVPFLSTNRSPCRKKSILAKVCFDVKRG